MTQDVETNKNKIELMSGETSGDLNVQVDYLHYTARASSLKKA